MKFIRDLKEGDRVFDIYLCKHKQAAVTKNGKAYENVILQDKTGTIDAKVWEPGNPGIGDYDTLDYIEVYGDVNNFQGTLQVSVKRIRVCREGEYNPADYLPVSAKDNDTMYLELLEYIESIQNPYLKKLQPEVSRSQMVKICGVGESQVEDQLLDLIDQQTNPTIATYAKTGEVHLRVTARGKNEEEAKRLTKPVVKEIKNRFGEHVYSVREEETLEMAVVRLLQKYELTVTTAESCTGGLIAGRIVNVPGASDVFREGFVTYSNKAKRKYLDVSKSTLKKYGAVSSETAREMAIGGVFATDCDACVAVTGIAGPDGGSEEKPVGLVYIAACVKGKVTVKKYQFRGNRAKVREMAVVRALDLLRRSILEQYR